MNCPECKTGILAVIETFPENMTKYRHYRCGACDEDVITREEISPISLRDLRRVKAAKRRGDKTLHHQYDSLVDRPTERALRIARQNAGNPFSGLLR